MNVISFKSFYYDNSPSKSIYFDGMLSSKTLVEEGIITGFKPYQVFPTNSKKRSANDPLIDYNVFIVVIYCSTSISWGHGSQYHFQHLSSLNVYKALEEAQ